jgi:branched-chain amino acid transport system substrate-binding protein
MKLGNEALHLQGAARGVQPVKGARRSRLSQNKEEGEMKRTTAVFGKRAGVSVVLLAVVVLAVSWFGPLTGVATAAPKEIVIGALQGLSGPSSEVMSRLAEGQKFAADWINSRGGITIKGEKYLVRVLGEDMKMSPDGTVAATNKLVFQDKVKFITGLTIPPFKFAVEPITGPNKVLRIDCMSIGNSKEMNANTPYTFNGLTSYRLYRPLLEYFMQTYPQVKKVALVFPEDPGIYETNEDYKQWLQKRNLTVVAEESYPFGTVDFYPVMTKVLSAKPDAILLPQVFSTWAGGIVKQARELGFKGPFMQSSYPGGDIMDILNVAGKAFLTDYVVPGHPFHKPESYTPMMNEIAKAMKAKGVEFNIDHLSPFESIWYLAQAIQKAQSLDTTAVKEAFEKMTKIDTPYGPGKMGGLKTFGINHVVVRPFPLVRFMNGDPQFIKWVTPDLP